MNRQAQRWTNHSSFATAQDDMYGSATRAPAPGSFVPATSLQLTALWLVLPRATVALAGLCLSLLAGCAAWPLSAQSQVKSVKPPRERNLQLAPLSSERESVRPVEQLAVQPVAFETTSERPSAVAFAGGPVWGDGFVGPPGSDGGAVNVGAGLPWAYAPVGPLGVSAPNAYSIAEVVELALKRHPSLRVRRFEIEAARARWVSAGLLPNPQLVIEEERETGGAARHETVAWMMFTMPIGPQRRLRRAAANADVEVLHARLSADSRRIVTAAVERAIDVQAWQEIVEIDARQRDTLAELAAVQAARFEAREATFQDKFVAELALADAELRLRSTIVGLATAQVELNTALGGTVFVMTGELPTIREPLRASPLPPLQLADVVARAKRVLPEIEEGWRMIEGNQQRWSAERWRAAPDVSVGPRYRDSMPGSSDRFGGRLAVDLPLFNRNQGGIREAAADIDASWARLQALELQATADVAAAFVALQGLDANLVFLEQHVLPLVESAATTLQQGFDAQLVAAQPLLETLAQAGRVRREHVELRRRHASLRARLELLLEARLSDVAREAGPLLLPAPDIEHAP